MRYPPDSIGLVVPKTVRFTDPLKLDCGSVLSGYELIYETYGELNKARNNAVLVCHALSGDHHAAGYHSPDDHRPGWWDNCIGPGKPIDTNRFHVVCCNNLGGCGGSTGPLSINPSTGKPWGPDFPQVRVRDWVKSQAQLADKLGVERWAAVIGGSLGGMQVMRWSIDYPQRVAHAIVVASALKLSAQNIAFNEIARQAITSDPNYHDGHFRARDTLPRRGLAIARMIGHVTYLSDELMGDKFGRELKESSAGEPGSEFQVESYLRHQGDAFSSRFDANTYLLITRVLDKFDLARDFGGDAIAAFRQSLCKFLVLSFSSDWRFAPARSREIVDALVAANKAVVYAEIEANQGHDAFLLPIERYWQILRSYMNRVYVEVRDMAPCNEV